MEKILFAEELAGAEFRPPFPFEIMKVGDEIEVWLLNSAKGGKIWHSQDEAIRLLSSCYRVNAIEIVGAQE
ncbi:MAG: hypothetical protein R2850_08200 [Bacteroidia bacterium]